MILLLYYCTTTIASKPTSAIMLHIKFKHYTTTSSKQVYYSV